MDATKRADSLLLLWCDTTYRPCLPVDFFRASSLLIPSFSIFVFPPVARVPNTASLFRPDRAFVDWHTYIHGFRRLEYVHTCGLRRFLPPPHHRAKTHPPRRGLRPSEQEMGWGTNDWRLHRTASLVVYGHGRERRRRRRRRRRSVAWFRASNFIVRLPFLTLPASFCFPVATPPPRLVSGPAHVQR